MVLNLGRFMVHNPTVELLSASLLRRRFGARLVAFLRCRLELRFKGGIGVVFRFGRTIRFRPVCFQITA
jgi:hypothetical protein